MKDDDATLDSADGQEAFRPAGRVGRYVIVEKIGEGGMGVVYSAFDDELDRHVALKLINPHGSPTAAHSRLVREARTMAKLQHPNVVAVYDAHTVGEAVYVAMEHVLGTDLRVWRAARPRTLSEILSVFVQAGRGLAAAHAAGIIHRDFKPANVLVGADGRTRVADFGLAMALGAPVPEDETGAVDDETSSRVTRSGELVGTPAYMSPEQHRGEPATPLSDQFGFCVSLYEAVCGQRPRTIDEVRRGEAPTDAPGAPAWLRAVLLRGLATDPANRYPTMDALLAELGRDPASRRRRWLFMGAAAVTASAVAWGALSLRRAEPCGGATAQLAGTWDDAQRGRVRQAFLATGVPYAEASLRAAGGVLDRYASSFADAYTEACRATRVRGEQSEEVMGRRMACFDRRRQSLAAIANVLAAADRDIVDNAARAARALPDLASCADAAALQSELPPPEDPEAQSRVAALRTRMDEARALYDAGKYARALEMADAAVAAAKPLAFLPLQADAELLRGQVLDQVNRYPEAEEAFYEAVYAAEAARHERALAQAWIGLIWMVGVRGGRYEEVPRVVRMADAALQRQGDPPDLRARYWSYRGSVATAQRKPDDADAAYRKALAIVEATSGADDLKATDLRFNLGTVAIGRGRYAEALDQFERALATYQGAYGSEHPITARAEHAVGNALVMLERNAEASEAYARAAAVREKLLGPDHVELANTLNGWGQALSSQGRHDEALEKLRRSLAIKEKTFGPNEPTVANTVASIGSCLVEKKDLDGARPWLERALAIRQKKWGDEHADVVNSLSRLTDLENSAGRYTEAVAYGTRAARVGEKVFAAGHPELGTVWLRLGQAHLGLRQADKARAALERAVDVFEKADAPSPQLAEAKALLAKGR